jgi:hypothetical protein
MMFFLFIEDLEVNLYFHITIAIYKNYNHYLLLTETLQCL